MEPRVCVRNESIRADEPQVVLGRALNKLVMDPIEALGLKLPWFNS
jgi:hypothetical protein